MTAPNRRPVIVGAGQLTQRVSDPKESAEPIGVMEQALRIAAEDAGAPALLAALDTIYVPQGLWKYGNPGALIAERVGAGQVETALGAVSGHIVQVLVDRACADIAAGKRDVVAIVGGESENSKRRLQRQGTPLHWNDEIPGTPDEQFGSVEYGIHKQELFAGVRDAVSCFSLCETSLRRSVGETPAAHRDRISALYASMSKVAADNPYAWIPKEHSAEQIRNPGPGNRMVSYPYTKLMTSNISVDQGAALIVCSEEAADRFGIASDRKVYLRAATEMSHTTHLSDRIDLHENPGQALAGQRVLELAACKSGDLDFVDLYSCFPFAVQAGAMALGIGLDPVPSLTGGMTFFGGPFANYVLHTKCQMIDKLRAQPGTTAAVGSVGGFFAHFSYGVYSTDPGQHAAPQIEDVSETYAAMPKRTYVGQFDGRATIESYTCAVDGNGPTHALMTGLTDAGARVWGRSTDSALMEAILADEEFCGRTAVFKQDPDWNEPPPNVEVV